MTVRRAKRGPGIGARFRNWRADFERAYDARLVGAVPRIS